MSHLRVYSGYGVDFKGLYRYSFEKIISILRHILIISAYKHNKITELIISNIRCICAIGLYINNSIKVYKVMCEIARIKMNIILCRNIISIDILLG